MKLSALRTLIYQRDIALPVLPDTPSFLSFVDRAIVNVRGALASYEPSVLEGLLLQQTSPVAHPSDLLEGEQTLFYREGTDIILSDDLIVDRNSQWTFNGTVDITYSKELPRFTDINAELPFTTRKGEEILISELLAMINGAFEQNEATEAVVNALDQSDRIS